jgi:glycosyltransferase involved in cell wall biosynthesis
MKVAITDDTNNQCATSCLGNSFNHGIKEEDEPRLEDLRFVHRVDGPTALIRGKDDGTDKRMFELNNKYADYTVFQSMWSLFNNIQQGNYPVNPVIIPNAVDPGIFNRNGKCKFSLKRKIRIISTSWSKNPRKGWDTYKWLDTNLDFERYEYTFVGNVPGEFKNIKLLTAVPSVALAGLLKNSDIYITASKNDPASNALAEALACGLPALYLDSGGHRELVGFGGLSFNKGREIPGKLVELISDYKLFQSLIRVERIQDIVERYLELFKRK